MLNKQYRRTRFLWLSLSQWRKRSVFWVGAVSIGVIACYFAMAADQAQALFKDMTDRWAYAPLILSPVVFGLCAWIANAAFPNAQGSGIPQAIAARHFDDPATRRRLLAPRMIFGKVALTLLGLLGGASIGREGPTVQVGAAILLMAASFGKLKDGRGVVLAGSAAGVAAAFNTPLAGIVFAIEEMARSFESRTNGLILTAIVLSGIASLAILGNYDYFGHTTLSIDVRRDGLACLVIGILGGLGGAFFSYIMVTGSGYARRAFKGLGGRHPVLFAGFCGLLAAGVGILCGGATFGTGYTVAKSGLQGMSVLPWWYAIAKFVSTSLAAVSGIPGGIFAPSLSVGAGMGSALSGIFSHTPGPVLILLGMVAYFSGVTQAPITAFVIVLEMTGSGSSVVPLIAAAMIASTVSHAISPVSLYHALAHNFIRQEEANLKALKKAEAPA
jgi:H+/Cl- antiporter ClcA